MIGSNKVNQKKYENLILYLCEKSNGTIFGKKKLAKLLYYVDFDNYEYKQSMKSITGDKYSAWKMGPVPEKYMDIVEGLVKKGFLEHDKEIISNRSNMKPVELFKAKKKADEDVFTEDEKFIINRVIRKYGGLDGMQLETLTHSEAPYVATEPNEEISYELAFYRGTVFEDELARA